MKNTKRALLTSVLALVMCVVMLVGSTFAWFTDSAVSANNKIVAGELDVQLLMHDGSNYVNIGDEESPIFGTGSIAQNKNIETLWEPGKTQVAYLQIANDGNLALKYQVAIEVRNDAKDLYEVMKYQIIPDAAPGSVDEWNYDAALPVVVGTNIDRTDVRLEKDAVHNFALAIHMDEEAGNEYMNGEVSFDIKVLATQDTVEDDSFGTDYDAEAPVIEVATADELDVALKNGNVAKLTADIDSNGARFDVPENTKAGIDLNGFTLTSKDGGVRDGVSHNISICVNRNAEFVLSDSVGGGELVSSCYGVYVQPNAKFIMNGGTITVTGNGAFDIGVTVWNGAFVMNDGTINAQYSVWSSNYYGNTDPTLDKCSVIISENATVNSTAYDIDYYDALDTYFNIPASLTTYPAA